MRVLIADDSKLIRSRLTRILSAYKQIDVIDEAINVHQAIDIVHKKNPNVLILDVKMPDGNGIEILHSIENDQYSPVVIVLTNFPFPEYEREYMMAGADFFFDKSSEFKLLKKVIENLIDNELRIKSFNSDERNEVHNIN